MDCERIYRNEQSRHTEGKMNPDTPLVYVLILSYNDCNAVLASLESVVQSDYPRVKVVLVDNASADDTINRVREQFPTVHCQINQENLGFAGGCNVGIRYALAENADYIFILNQDTTLFADCIRHLVDCAEQQKHAGILGPKTYTNQLDAQGKPIILYAGSWMRYLPLLQKIPGIGRGDLQKSISPQKTDFVWGHGMLLRRAMLDQIGLFDDAYFFYYEDIDLCWRARQFGWELWYVPDAVMIHNISDGARAEKSEMWRWRLKAKGMHRFYQKFFGMRKGTLFWACTTIDMGLHMLKKFQIRAFSHLLFASFEEIASQK